MRAFLATALAWACAPLLILVAFVWALCSLGYHGYRYLRYGETNWNHWGDPNPYGTGQMECDVKASMPKRRTWKELEEG